MTFLSKPIFLSGDPHIHSVPFHQTTSNNVQSIIESRVEKRTKGVYVPFGGKSMITFMDDLNMPAKDMFGSQPPLELIRLWIDYGFWYDRSKQTIKYIRVSLPRVCSSGLCSLLGWAQSSPHWGPRLWSCHPGFLPTQERPVSMTAVLGSPLMSQASSLSPASFVGF